MNSLLFVFLAAVPVADAVVEHWDSPIIILGKLAVIVGLVVLNAFFVACEFSIVKVRGSQLDALEDEGNAKAAFAKHVRGGFDAFRAVTQLGVTLASLALGWICDECLARILQPAFAVVGVHSHVVGS